MTLKVLETLSLSPKEKEKQKEKEEAGERERERRKGTGTEKEFFASSRGVANCRALVVLNFASVVGVIKQD